MDRYQYNKILIDENNKKYFSTNILPNFPNSEDDTYIITYKGMRLDIVSYNYYGDSTMWWIIASINNNYDSIYIKEEKQLRIPSLESINNYIANIISENNF